MKKKNYINKVKRSKFINFSRHGKIRLDKNEKIDKFSDNFLKSMKAKLSSEIFTAYPEVLPLISLIGKKYKISKENILLTAGIDSALKAIIEGYTNKRNNVLILEPTFAMTSIYCKLANLNIIKIHYDNNLKLDFKKLFKNINQKIKLIILSNPNSPTGTIIDDKNLIKILKKAKKFKVPVVIDEAYYGFTKKTSLKLILKYNNLFITRTFSKVFGLAGLRAGFIASNIKNIEYLSKLKPMYEINSVAIEAVKILLKREDLVKKYVKETHVAKKKLINILKKNNLEYFDTHTNFLLIDFKNFKNKVLKFANKNNILISKNSPLKNYLRVTLGPFSYLKKIINIIG